VAYRISPVVLDQTGDSSRTSSDVRRVSRPDETPAVQRSHDPPKSPARTTRRPSGDQDGCLRRPSLDTTVFGTPPVTGIISIDAAPPPTNTM